MRFITNAHHSLLTRAVPAFAACSVALLFLTSCSSAPHTPAPVETLDMRIAESQGPFQQDVYTVQAGDTLFAIAFYSGNDYRDIARYNGLSAPFVIQPGDKLRLTAPPPRRNVTNRASPNNDVASRPVATKPTSPSVKPPAQNPRGRTSAISEQAAVDRTKEQAYGETEKDVNRQQVRQHFPARVERWVWPAVGRIIGRFDDSESGNKGVDIANTSGTPVVAAASGKVVYTGGALRGYGKLVIIKHTDTFLSAYAHNDRILVNEQQWVRAGEQIGTMGSSGTNKVMLHFEVRYRGQSLDPMRYLPRQ